jgi:hypothetical protein
MKYKKISRWQDVLAGYFVRKTELFCRAIWKSAQKLGQ